jgi:hypothetical protein
MVYKLRPTVTCFVLLFVSMMLLTIVSYNSIVSAQEGSNKTSSFVNETGSNFSGYIDIPSVDIPLADNSSVSPDFRSIYFNSDRGQIIYANYDDYALPENKPTIKAGDNISIDVYSSQAPKPYGVKASISKILSGQETGNFTEMTVDKPIQVTSTGNTFTIPNATPGGYILNTFVTYPFSGIGIVYTMQFNIK